jgi:hypothetical protein
MDSSQSACDPGQGLRTYYKGKIEGLEMRIREKQMDLRRMEAQRNELNTKGTLSCSHVSVFRVLMEKYLYLVQLDC